MVEGYIYSLDDDDDEVGPSFTFPKVIIVVSL